MRAEHFPRDVIRFWRSIPFTPIQCFEDIGVTGFNPYLPDPKQPAPGPAGSDAAEGVSAPSAVDLLDD